MNVEYSCSREDMEMDVTPDIYIREDVAEGVVDIANSMTTNAVSDAGVLTQETLRQAVGTLRNLTIRPLTMGPPVVHWTAVREPYHPTPLEAWHA